VWLSMQPREGYKGYKDGLQPETTLADGHATTRENAEPKKVSLFKTEALLLGFFIF